MNLTDKTALLVIDVQNDFCDESGVVRRYAEDCDGIRKAIDQLGRLLTMARETSCLVVFVRSLMDDKYKLPSLLRKHSNLNIKEQICREGTPGADFHRLRPADRDCIVTKHTTDAFLYTFLVPLLWKNQVTDVVLTGVYTEICVADTARSALQRGFNTVIVKDCTAGLSKQCADIALDHLQAMQASVVSLEEILHPPKPKSHSKRRAELGVEPRATLPLYEKVSR